MRCRYTMISKDIAVYEITGEVKSRLFQTSVKDHTYPRLKGRHPRPRRPGDREGSVACMKSDKTGATGIGPEETTILSQPKGHKAQRRSAMVRIVSRLG